MSLPQMTAEVNIIQTLETRPNAVGGLTAAQLKAKFDQAPAALKSYLNNDLIPALEDAFGTQAGTLAGCVHFDAAQGLTDAQKTQARSNIGAAAAADVPTKVSELTNDSGFVTAQGAASAAPVQSVAGKTGAVGLIAEDVGYQSNAPVYTEPPSHVEDALGGLETFTQKAVRFDAAQSLTDAQKARARDNIDAAATSGEYDSLVAGLAKNLKATVGVTDAAPYTLRTAGGSLDVGDRMLLKKLVGCTFGWNQKVQNGNFAGSSGWNLSDTANSSLTISDNVATVSSTSSNSFVSIFLPTAGRFPGVSGHRYLIGATVQSSDATFRFAPTGSNGGGLSDAFTCTSKTRIWYLWTPASDTTVRMDVRGYPNSGVSSYSYTVENLVCFDLTEIFGATIADHIATLESGTAGAGVAWFRKLFPKDWYAYDAGSLQSVNTSAHRMVGFNAYDNATGKAQLVGGQEYQITGTYTALSFGGASVTLTGDDSDRFTPPVSGELTVTGGNATDTCVHLVWDGERNGEFEAYAAHSYALDEQLELRGLPGLDASGNFIYDGDELAPDGTVTRKYAMNGQLDSLTWVYHAATKTFYTQDLNPEIMAPASNSAAGQVKLPGYVNTTDTAIQSNLTADKLIAVDDNGTIEIRDLSFTDAATFAATLSGKTLLYKLVTATAESADAYTEEQIVDNWGAEKFVDAGVAAATPTRDVEIPVGQEAWYPADLKAKLETLPSVPAGDGDYVLEADGGEYSYKALSSAGAISSLNTRVPAAPTTDGTYVLKCTVSDGTATFSWTAGS